MFEAKNKKSSLEVNHFIISLERIMTVVFPVYFIYCNFENYP